MCKKTDDHAIDRCYWDSLLLCLLLLCNESRYTHCMTILREHNSLKPAAEHLLHRLYAVQQQFLHISPQSMQQIAAEFSVPLSQVASVVAFYSFFSTQPRGQFDILFSNCTSCGYLQDGHNLLLMLAQQLHVTPGTTRNDGIVSIDETSCIGMCDQGASMLVNGRPLTQLNTDRIVAIALKINANIPPTEWPAEWFEVHERIYQRSLLLSEQFIRAGALKKALSAGAEQALDTIMQSGLCGRGGAGFNTGKKWQFCRNAPGHAHYVVCNADEGEPGTFKDRLLLHQHADTLFEGMTLCAFAIGAKKGFVYLRGEYRHLLSHLLSVLEQRRCQGLLGKHILGDTHFHFDIEIVVGAGAYICGEESALIESLEGKPGIPRIRPPFPVTQGYRGQPTVVNNVETFIAAAQVMAHGSKWFKAVGTEHSTGSKILSISGDCRFPGIYEYPFGTRIQKILDDCGAYDMQAIQIGGPAGKLIGSANLHRTISFEDLPSGGSFLIFGQQRDLLTVHRNFARFFAHESCGFCTPCRVGTQLLKNSLDKIANGHGTAHDVSELKRLSDLIQHHSHCGLGHTAANHVLDSLQDFPQTFEPHLKQQLAAQFDLDQALACARQIRQRHDTTHPG